MNIKKVFTTRSVFLRFLISYALVLTIPIFISATAYFQIGKIVEKEINIANASLLKQVQDIMDGRLSQIEQISIQIGLNERIKNAVNADLSFQTMDPYAYFEVIREMKAFINSSNIIANFYIYLKNTDVILSTDSRFDVEDFYEYEIDSERTGYEEWIGLISGLHARDYSTVYVNDYSNDQATAVKTVAYMQSIPIANPQNTLVVVLDEKKFKLNLENIEWIKSGQVFIMDEDNRIISSTGSMDVTSLIGYRSLEGNEGLVYENINDEKMAISYVRSKVNNWKYVSVIPYTVFWESARYVKNLVYISIIFCVFFGSICAYLLSRKNYNPIKLVTQELGRISGQVFDRKENNEFEFINRTVNMALGQKNELSEKLKKQQNLLRDNFMIRLLNGRLDDEISLNEMLSQYDMNFSEDNFIVILFSIEEYNSLFADGQIQEGEKQSILVKFIIRNVVEDVFNKQNRCYTAEVNDKIIACIVNFPEEWNLENIKKEIESAKDFFTSKFNIYCTISVSDPHLCLKGISQAYREAVDTLQYRMLYGKSKIILFKDIKGRLTNYSYNFSHEPKLINFIKSGDIDKSKEIIEEIFLKNTSNPLMSVEMAKCLMYDLTGTFIKTLDQMYDSSFIEELNPLKRLLSCETVSDMKFELTDIVESICQYEQVKKQNRNLSNEVMKYIQNNYSDMNLSVGMLGEVFNMSPSYLSKLFKDQTGDAVIDYVNVVRISKAKPLLEKNVLNINEIAEKVGFSNSNALIRIFKKYEGITPGRFKELCLKTSSEKL